MAIIGFRESWLEYSTQSPAAYDENGDLVGGSHEWTGHISCDVAVSGGAAEITLPNGVVTRYSYTLNLDRDCREFRYGDRIRLHVLGYEGVELTVKGFHRYQLQCRLWA